MENKTKGAGDDYPVIPQEPIFIPAGDIRVLLNGQPPFVPCRVVAEERYQLMKKELASLKEVVKDLLTIAETQQKHLQAYSKVFPNLSKEAQINQEVIDRAKRLSDNK